MCFLCVFGGFVLKPSLFGGVYGFFVAEFAFTTINCSDFSRFILRIHFFHYKLFGFLQVYPSDSLLPL